MGQPEDHGGQFRARSDPEILEDRQAELYSKGGRAGHTGDPHAVPNKGHEVHQQRGISSISLELFNEKCQRKFFGDHPTKCLPNKK